jgi:hypothetical protein
MSIIWCYHHEGCICHWDKWCMRNKKCMIDKLDSQTRYIPIDENEEKWKQADHVLTYGE